MGAVGTNGVSVNVGANPTSALNSLESIKNAVNQIESNNEGYEQWLQNTAKSFADDMSPDSTVSMSDIEGVAMSYALINGIANDDKVIDDLRNAIDAIVNKPPMRTGQFWDNNTISDALKYVKKNPDLRKKLLSKITSASDRTAISNVISDGWAESFDKYDSDVAEQFLTQYEKLIKKK